MVTLHTAYTAPINPSNASPVLTSSQVWLGLQRKIRHAEEFVPVIESCKVISDDNGVVNREVVFKEGAVPMTRAKEIVRSYWPTWVDFEQEDGTIIRNIVSDGPSGEPSDLLMTYTFQMKVPHAEGSPEADAALKKFKGTAKMAVEKSIETIRNMVKAGTIPIDQ